jgi:hypothetical protein
VEPEGTTFCIQLPRRAPGAGRGEALIDGEIAP